MLDPVIFDLEKMNQLYDYAYEQAKQGYEWTKVPPGLDKDEIYISKDK